MVKRLGDGFLRYEKSRKPLTQLLNLLPKFFLEMSSKTADDKFLLQKKIEKYSQIGILISGFLCIVE
jgi:hypothetical protein